MTWRFLSARLSGPRWLGAAALALGLVLLVALAVQASLPNGTPARPASHDLWGELEPTDPAGQPLPDGRDTTGFNEFQTSYWLVPWWMSIDIEGGRIFTIGSQSLQIWDATGDPTNPSLLGSAGRSAIIQRVSGEDATGWPMRDLDLPPNNTQVAAVVGAVLGVTIWDTRNPSSPANVYQLPGEGHEVHATTIGGRHYAFVASGDGLLVFDMSQALQLTRCLDNTAGTGCSGVFRGHLGAVRGVDYVDGTGTFLAAAAGNGVEIWNVAGAPAGQLEVHALKGMPTRGVALWRDVDSTAYYLAVVVSRFIAGQGLAYEGRIYDMSCLNSSSCQDAGPLLTTINLGRNHGIRSFVTFSRSGPNAFLYFGTDNRTGGGPQREFLVDVTNPDNPSQTRDITPQGTIVSDGKTVDYWSWYYEGNNGPNNLQGFNGVGPRRGKFLGEYFYRAAWSIFDIHRRTAGLPPAAEFDWVSREADPEKIYPGSLVDFFDRSTGQPAHWDWFFQNGSPLTSPLRNPQGVVFDLTGPFPTTTTVSLISSNDAGQSDPMTKQLTILDPAPSVAGVSSNVDLATVCQPITFQAQDVSGKSPLVFSWEVLDTDNNDLTVTGPTTPDTDPSRFVWDTTPFQTLDGDRSFRARVTVTGTGDPASTSELSPEVVLRPLAPLPAAGSFAPTHDDFVTGEVQFHVSVLGATEWLWDFGDGTVGEWTSDPVEGPNPVHVYEEIGTFEVTVQVRNCTNPDNPITSAPLEVDIVTIEVLHAEFEAVTGPGGVTCFPDIGGCKWFAKPGDEIAFEDRSTGAQEYHYDWDGNGSFEEGPLSSPRLSHKYLREGEYTPKLKVVGLGDEKIATHPFVINIEGGGSTPPPPPPPPSSAKIFVSGPITGIPGTAYEFRATATGCTPAAAGWSWEVSRGGQIVGVPSSSTINVSWPSTGRKLVSARNSGCGSAVGSTAITLTDSTTPPPPPPPPTGGDLEASFTFSPQNPAPGQTVIFNGSASTGDPTTYTWSFGDGQRQDTSSPTVQHVYAAPGSYQVALAVSRPGTCTNFGICSSHDTKKTIVVSGTPVDPEPEPEPALTICPDDPDALCFLDGRFKVSVTWSDPVRSGDSGIGKPLAEDPLPDQDTTGFFWFFNPNSVDLIVKFLDGAPNGAVWFFSGGLSDAEYTIRVEDRAAEPHTVKTYENIAGNICGLADTEAFPQVASLPGGQTVVLTGHSLDGGISNVAGAGASGLHADFTFSPQNPAPGQPVVFNASASTGDPDTYTWVFGDGGRPVSTSGPTVEHVYAEPGTYEVRLAVSRPGSCTNFGICSSPDTKKSIVVSGEPFDPGPGDDSGGDDSGGDDSGGDDSGGDDSGGDDGGGETVTGDTAACEPDAETLCLLDGRFEVTVDWRNPRPPFNSGTGRAIEGTEETGYFWFFSPTNVELVMKMIDGHPVNGYFWVFFGALTDVEYDIAVRDTETGLTETYTNAAGNICGQADTQAFE